MSWSRRGFLRSASALAAVSCARAPLADEAPNVVLVFADQLRSMALSVYGQTAIDTPVFDRMIRDGVSFRHALTPHPLCGPARAALLTGHRALSLGVADNETALPNVATLGHRLGVLGYRTGYVGKWHLDGTGRDELSEGPRGFDWFRAHNSRHSYLDPIYIDETGEEHRPGRYGPTAETDLGLDFLAADVDAPSFLTLSWGPPHPTGAAPTSYRDQLPAEWFDQVGTVVHPDNVPQHLIFGSKYTTGAEEYMRGYYAATASLDQELGRLLDGIEALGLTDRTLVIVTSDHGEMGGSHGRYQKGRPYEEAVRVPLAWWWPGMLTPHEITAPFTLRDLVPTLIGLLGLRRDDALSTVDASSWILGDEPDETTAYVEGGQVGTAPFEMVRSEQFTVARVREELLVFDNETDPNQLENLAETEKGLDIAEDLLPEIESWKTRLS